MTEQTERDRDNDNILRPSWFLINYAVSPSSNTVSYDPGIAGNLICISCKPNLFFVFSPLLYRKSSFSLGFLFLLLFFYLFYLMVQVIDKPKNIWDFVKNSYTCAEPKQLLSVFVKQQDQSQCKKKKQKCILTQSFFLLLFIRTKQKRNFNSI